MYEESRRELDWKGIFLKVVIAFLVVLIGLKVYTSLKGNNNENDVTTKTVAKAKTSSTFATNIDALKKAGESYFKNNSNQVPSTEGSSKMVTLNELINAGEITALTDEEGKACDGESSYVNSTLEGSRLRIKANLVCGTASSYALTYIDNVNATKETNSTTTTTNAGTTKSTVTKSSETTTSNNTNSSASKTTSTTVASSAPQIKVTTETKVNQEVKINTNASAKTNDTVYTADKVTVYFDSNGGNISYPSVRVKIGESVTNPGSTYKNGYTFIGWYLNGYKFDFNSKIMNNITLVARYVENNNYYNYDYSYNYNNNNYMTSYTETTNVYSSAWKPYGTTSLQVSHTIKVPSYITSNYKQIRIKSIQFVQPINTEALGNAYINNFNNTFIYRRNGGEIYTNNPSFFATVYNAYFSYDSSYKTRSDAINNGFNVSWSSTNVSRQCSMPYSGTLANGNSVTNVCGYGINYRVVWEYLV